MAKAILSGRKPSVSIKTTELQMSLMELRISTTLTLQDVADLTGWSTDTIEKMSRGIRKEQGYHRRAFYYANQWAIANGYAVKEVA